MILTKQFSGCRASLTLHGGRQPGTAILSAQFRNSCCKLASDPTFLSFTGKFNNYKKKLGKRPCHLLHESLQRNLTLRHHFPLCAELSQLCHQRETPARAASQSPVALEPKRTLSLTPRFTPRRRTPRTPRAPAFRGVPSFRLAQNSPVSGRCSPPCLAHSQRRPGQQPGSWLCLSLRGAVDLDSISSAPQPAHLGRGNCAVPVSSPSHVLPGQPQYPDL
jgi:hypothetical protein